MGKRNICNAQSGIAWQIRNNVRRGNYSKVSELTMGVLRRENSDETKHDLLKAIYNDCIFPFVEGTGDLEPVPKQYENMFLEYARYAQGQRDTETALKILESIKESENPKIRKKVKRQINLSHLSQELSKGDGVDADAVEKIAEDIERDKDSWTYAELISSVFGTEFPIEKLELGELEKYISETHREISHTDTTSIKGSSYPEELQVENRMKFLKEELDIRPVIRYCDEGIFSGSILLELEDTDAVLVEKIMNIYANGTYEPNNYGSSTYILPQDKMLDLIKLETRKKVKDQLRDSEDKEIAPYATIQHRKYWKEKIKEAVERMKVMSKVQTNVTYEQVQDEDDETIEPEQTVHQGKFKSKNRIANNTIANREFLQDINTSLDGILTNEMIEQLIKRTVNYSFDSIYNNGLKQKIFESLELLETPEEQMDTEAKKIFLVMQMTREDMSRLTSEEGSKNGISEEELAYLAEQYSCYYNEALVALKTGMAQGLDYKQITNAMKNCVIEKEISTQEIGRATINAPTELKKVVEQVEAHEKTEDNIKEGEGVGDDN